MIRLRDLSGLGSLVCDEPASASSGLERLNVL